MNKSTEVAEMNSSLHVASVWSHLNPLDLESDALVLVFAVEDDVTVDVVDGFDVLRHHGSDLVASLDRVILLLNRARNTGSAQNTLL